jgi:hypothetical protein
MGADDQQVRKLADASSKSGISTAREWSLLAGSAAWTEARQQTYPQPELDLPLGRLKKND